MRRRLSPAPVPRAKTPAPPRTRQPRSVISLRCSSAREYGGLDRSAYQPRRSRAGGDHGRAVITVFLQETRRTGGNKVVVEHVGPASASNSTTSSRTDL